MNCRTPNVHSIRKKLSAFFFFFDRKCRSGTHLSHAVMSYEGAEMKVLVQLHQCGGDGDDRLNTNSFKLMEVFPDQTSLTSQLR